MCFCDFLFCFSETVSHIWSIGWPGTCYINQAGLELKEPSASVLPHWACFVIVRILPQSFDLSVRVLNAGVKGMCHHGWLIAVL